MRRRAFTLIELMVAIGATVLLLGIVGVAFNHARDAMSLGIASAAVNTQAKALESNLRRDISQMNTDGFLAIRSVNVQPVDELTGALKVDELTGTAVIHEADQLLFFASGAFTSAQQPAGAKPVQATAARIQYGHLVNLSTAPAIANPEAPGSKPLEWVLGRQAMLLASPVTPGLPTVGRVSNFWELGTFKALQGGLIDVATVTLRDVREEFAPKIQTLSTAPPSLTSVPAPIQIAALLRVAGRPYADLSPSLGLSLDDHRMYAHAVMAAQCSRFRVEYWNENVNDGPLNNQPARFERASDLMTPPAQWVVVAGYGATATSGNSGRGPAIEWPKALRITVTLHDPELRFHERHLLAPGDTPDGRTYQWVFDLPKPAF